MTKKRSAEEAIGDAEEAPENVEEEVGDEPSVANEGEQEAGADDEVEAGDEMDDLSAEEEKKEEEDSAQSERDDQEDSGSNEKGQRTGGVFRKINLEGKPAEAGVIKSVYCENFMCHRKLKVDLCRNVNFINGQNGSGKSAILASIQICLGANARLTNRARNLKDLVRKEAAGNNPNTSAKIRVTLLNGGDDAYKSDVYGSEITVERCISLRGGYNGYRLLDEQLKEVSKEKKELDAMLDHLNIQVDNPMAILDQEHAKRFLNGKASEKYEFFMKATELERIDRVYAETKDKTEDLKVKHERVVNQLEEKAAVAAELKKKYELHTGVQKLEKKLFETNVAYSWAFFGERDAEYQESLQKQNAFKEKVASRQLELSQAEEEASGANDADEEKRIREEMEELGKEAETQADLKRNLEVELKQVMVPFKSKERDVKSLKQEKDRAGKELQRAKKRLQETRAEIMEKAGSAESEEARRTALLTETEEALSNAREESNGLKQAQALAHREYEELGPEVEQAKQSTATKASHLSAVRHKLNDLKSSSAGNSFAIFGRKCANVHKLVEDAKQKRRFQGDVLGPIGAYIKAAPGKENYIELAEKALGGGNLDRFIVTNDHDRKVLQSLRDQAQCTGKECGLYQVSVSDRYNVPRPPVDDIETVASALVISNDIVFNCLVDNARIDQRALAPSKEVSEQHLLLSNNGRYSIRGNINEVFFLPNGDKWTVRDGAISISSNEQQLRGRKIGVDRSAAIAEAERELGQLEAEVKELRATEADLTRRQKELQRKWNNDKRAFKQNQDKIEQLSNKIEDIRNEMETTANTTIDTTELEEDVANAEEQFTKLEEEETERQKELDEMEPAIEDVRNRLDEVRTRNEKVLLDMQAAEEKLEACVNRQTQSETIVQKKREKLEKALEITKKHQARVDEKHEERKKALRQARTLSLKQRFKEEQEEAGSDTQVKFEYSEEDLEGVEIETVPKNSDFYLAKIQKCKAKIEKEKEKKALSNDDPAAALQKWQNARKHLEDCQQQAEDLKDLVETLEKDIKDRQRRWKKLQGYLAKMTDSKFDSLLQLNKSCGHLEFDNEKNQLDLVVQKDINDPGTQTKDVKALSGGERSYTTMSLLFALGESLETPFRVMDEFDVFLDTQARKLVIQTLIHIALTQMQHRQFIFITPQDLSSVTPQQQVKIFKLKPPERNNIAGGASQQTLSFSQGP